MAPGITLYIYTQLACIQSLQHTGCVITSEIDIILYDQVLMNTGLSVREALQQNGIDIGKHWGGRHLEGIYNRHQCLLWTSN